MGSDLVRLLQFCHSMLFITLGIILAAEWGIEFFMGNRAWYFLEFSNSASDGNFGANGVAQ